MKVGRKATKYYGFFSFIFFLAFSQSLAFAEAPLNGNWNLQYSCEGATGMYAEKCTAGDHDRFSLWFGNKGSKFCGSYELTAQLGNHVDDGDITDWIISEQPDHTYHIHFHVTGIVGDAVVHIDNDKLYWKTLSKHKDAGNEYVFIFEPPDSAILTRNKAAKNISCDRP